jgi:ribosomal protein S18 acetylase RimI-like enzyme
MSRESSPLWHTVADVLPSSTDDEPAVRALLARDPEALLVSEDDGRTVATVIVGWDGWRGNLYRLAVDPASRRVRVASSLIGEAERRLTAKDAGASRLRCRSTRTTRSSSGLPSVTPRALAPAGS